MKIEIYTTGGDPLISFFAAQGFSHTIEEPSERAVSLCAELETYCRDNFTPEQILAEETQAAVRQAAKETARAKEEADSRVRQAQEEAEARVEAVKQETQDRIREIEEKNQVYRETALRLTPEWNGDSVEYAKGQQVVYRGEIYACLQGHTSQADWSPGHAASLWVEGKAEGEIPQWKQPAGAHDAYKKGDEVTYQGKVYRSKIDANTWSPAEYPAGWEEA